NESSRRRGTPPCIPACRRDSLEGPRSARTRRIKTRSEESPMMAASAPGKLILFGEHAVVFGEPALSTAINLRAEVYARPHTEWLVDGASLEESRFRYVKAAVAKAKPDSPLWIEIRSMVPSGAGLGSSAAVTVATLGALHGREGSIEPLAIAREAFEVEHEVQGRASPIDTSTASAGGGILVLRQPRDGLLWSIERDKHKWFVHRTALPPLDLVIGNTGISAATGPLVAKVKDRVDRDPRAAEAVRQIGEITLDGVRALQRKDLVAAGKLMDRNHTILTDLGVGHPSSSCLRPDSSRWEEPRVPGRGRPRANSVSSKTGPCTPREIASSTSARRPRSCPAIRGLPSNSMRRGRS